MVFIPISHFDASAPIADALGSASGIQCRIIGLHDGTTFHFPHARDFRLFQTLVTYQQSCLTRENRGIGIKFDSMSVRFSHRIGFRNEVQMFGAGHVQVLYRLSDREYQDWVLDRAEAARLSTAHSRSSLEPTRTHSTANGFYLATSPTPGALPKSASTYRLALYTTIMASPPKRPIVDRQDCIPTVDPQSNARKVTFRENFLAAIYEAAHDVSQDFAASYPGYPVIPDFVDAATSDRDSSLGRVIKKMDLIMNTAQDHLDLFPQELDVQDACRNVLPQRLQRSPRHYELIGGNYG
nr:hypothetical protein CFP56_03775 [Quercus suber]